MKLSIDSDVHGFLAKLDAKRFSQIGRKMFLLTKDPYPHGSLLLKGCSDVYRTDVGEYRIIYRVVDDTVEILVIGKRHDDDVYK